MSGLILKDLYNIRKQAIWYVVMIILFSVLSIVLKNAAFAYAIGILVTISIPLAAIAYEEKDGWQKFAIACGMDIKTIVGEKFFFRCCICDHRFCCVYYCCCHYRDGRKQGNGTYCFYLHAIIDVGGCSSDCIQVRGRERTHIYDRRSCSFIGGVYCSYAVLREDSRRRRNYICCLYDLFCRTERLYFTIYIDQNL